MAVNYGSKRIVVGAHYGLRDWLAQRVTAALMALFTLLVLGQVMLAICSIASKVGCWERTGYTEGWSGVMNRSTCTAIS